MADVPLDPRLFAMVVNQAKAKYRVYPSPGASHWVHKRYMELGGQFGDTDDKTRREKLNERMEKQRELEKRAHNDHSATKDEDLHKKRTGYDKKKK